MDAIFRFDWPMKITKRSVDALAVTQRRYFAWDDTLPGFGVRVEASGRKTFLCRYRLGGVRRQYSLGRYGPVTADQARTEARRVLGAVAHGADPSSDRQHQRGAIRFAALVDVFLEGHGPKLKPRTREDYASALTKHVVPLVGHIPAEAVTPNDLNTIHVRLAEYPHRANRVMAYVGSVYSWAAAHGYVAKGINPASGVRRFRENGRERYLTGEELQRLGSVLHQAETQGLPWTVNASGETARHLPHESHRRIVYPRHVTGAIRLLLLTGCRLREILNLRWPEVDLERGLLLLPDSKTGRKTVILNAAAVSVLASLERTGTYVIPGNDPNKPRHDLKRPWDHIRAAAELGDVRLHDLRHTHASIGAGAGFGLPIVGRLLGHASAATTQRYAHIADDPARRASEAIGAYLAGALDRVESGA